MFCVNIVVPVEYYLISVFLDGDIELNVYIELLYTRQVDVHMDFLLDALC